MPERVVILDGALADGDELEAVRAVVCDELGRRGAQAELVSLRDERIAHCIGCFGCWLETPGLCRSQDRGGELLAAMLRSDTTVLLTPVTFGGYSSVLKCFVDHWVQTVLPFFTMRLGETHHPLRYARFPRLVGIGVQREQDGVETELFEALVGRNALNFRAPSYSAGVVTVEDGADVWRRRISGLLAGSGSISRATVLAARVPPGHGLVPGSSDPRPERALLVVGSPKTKSPSTSGVLGGQLLAGLEARGWTTATVTVTAAVRAEPWRERMLAAVDAADLVVLAFPLYIDALPYLLTAVLEAIAARRRLAPLERPQRLAVIVNSGFPEAQQNALAASICARFAASAGMAWAGALLMGAGEALSSGQPLTSDDRRGRPPVAHVIRALDLAAEALAVGEAIPEAAAAGIAKTPIPVAPFAAWRWLFSFLGGHGWRREAKSRGVGARAMLARPYLYEASQSER